MKTTITSLEQLDSMSLPADQASEIEVGCEVYQWSRGSLRYTLTVWPSGRGAIASNGDSQWGDWRDGKLELDEGGWCAPYAEEACVYHGCKERATAYDVDGDKACEECAARSFSWVITTDLTNGTWLDKESAASVEEWMSGEGWNVTIREPRRGEFSDATYHKTPGGLLQVIRTPELLDRALEEAVRRLL